MSRQPCHENFIASLQSCNTRAYEAVSFTCTDKDDPVTLWRLGNSHGHRRSPSCARRKGLLESRRPYPGNTNRVLVERCLFNKWPRSPQARRDPDGTLFGEKPPADRPRFEPGEKGSDSARNTLGLARHPLGMGVRTADCTFRAHDCIRYRRKTQKTW